MSNYGSRYEPRGTLLPLCTTARTDRRRRRRGLGNCPPHAETWDRPAGEKGFLHLLHLLFFPPPGPTVNDEPRDGASYLRQPLQKDIPARCRSHFVFHARVCISFKKKKKTRAASNARIGKAAVSFSSRTLRGGRVSTALPRLPNLRGPPRRINFRAARTGKRKRERTYVRTFVIRGLARVLSGLIALAGRRRNDSQEAP